MILHTRAGLYAAANVDTEGTNSPDRSADIFHPQPAGENKLGGIAALDPFPGKRLSRAAVARRPGIEQIKIRREIVHAGEPIPPFQTEGLDDFHIPAAA